MLVSCATGAPDDDTKVEVIKADGYDVSPPLTELAKIPVPELSGLRAHEAEPVRPIPHMRAQSLSQQQDPVVQSTIGSGLNILSPIVSFEGMGAGLAGFTVQSAPPDTDGDVGPNHYVQVVNSSVTIFNKTGGKVLGPVLTRTFFANFAAGVNCQNTNDGDGVVRYDRYADRWIIAQFSVNSGSGPFFQCIAVSTSPDPTGSYNRYQFSYTGFNDYPKIAIWPTQGGGGVYIVTYNIFNGNTFAGAKACEFDRAKMLAGAAVTQQCFDTGNTIGGLLASDVDGPTLPPAGSPHYLLALDTNRLAFFKIAGTVFTGPTFITTAAFTPLCNGGTCVVQPGTTQRLDSLADRLMNRLVYRNFGDHEALLVSHAVAAGTGGGVRFYELRNPATTPTIFQQGTYAPDAAFRWMSSMAFDGSGNIGMGFSISSSTINPSIRYTGRLTTDALGTMGQPEDTIIAGTGSQTGSNLSRWGDYSSLNIDPTDDCTFWFTSEYMGASGAFNWHTRIGSFKFANCGNGGGGCINGTFTSANVPLAIPDNNATGITSVNAVTGNGTVGSLSLSLNITHTFSGDLVVTLISPGGTQFVVSNRVGGAADNIVINNLAIAAFNGQTAAGTWRLKVQDLAGADIGTLNSWSLTIVGNCTTASHWSGSATPTLPTIDNGTVCNSLTVAAGTGGDAALAKLDISGSHDFRSSLRGTLAHASVIVEAFPVNTFPTGAGTFSFINRSEPGFTGDPAGTWTLCIVDTDAFGDTGVLNTWSVHD